MPAAEMQLGDVIGVAARAAVDDRRTRTGVGQDVQERGALARDGAGALQRDDVEREVGPIEPGPNRCPLAQPETRSDLIGHTRSGGRGGSHHRRPSERGDRIVQAQIVRSKVMAPLGDAVGLVDDEQRDAPLSQSLAERAGGETLGGRKHE